MQTAQVETKTKKSGKSRKTTTRPTIPAAFTEMTAAVETPNLDTPMTKALIPTEILAAEPTAMDTAIPENSAPVLATQLPAESKIELIDLNKIVNSTYNPRKDLREETLLELSDSIRQVGVLQPICVRPKDEGYEIVYGERRYWAAAMANLSHIPALVREMSDAEAEDVAITENLQREDVKPREEAAAYKRALQSGRHTVESLVGKFGKSEAYIRSRLKLCELIDSLSEQLDKEEISVGVATEIAKYPADIQQEVYDEHFAEACRISWKNARIREIARRLYECYMTKLDTYRFDKAECLTCHHNTANQVLFRDECSGGCAGCQNRECMLRKNNEYLMQTALKLLKDDPRTTLATNGETPAAVLESLEQEGYQVEELEYHMNCYDETPEMPEAPKAEDCTSEEAFTEAREEYDIEMGIFAEETQQLEFDVSEGRVRKYAVIGNLDVVIRYEKIPEEQQEVTVADEQGSIPRQVFVTVLPPSPLEALEAQDNRNRQLCYEHITTDMKRVLADAKVANTPLQKEETQMFYYAVMQRVGSDSRLKQCGFKPKEDGWLTRQEQFAAAGRLTEKQQAALMRAFLVDYFRASAPECRCTDETLDTQLLCRFADLNFTEQSHAVQQEYLQTYEKRKARLQEQIDGLTVQVEQAACEASLSETPQIAEPEESQTDPDESPLWNAPQPTTEPMTIPADPEIEPQGQMSSLAIGIAA